MEMMVFLRKEQKQRLCTFIRGILFGARFESS